MEEKIYQRTNHHAQQHAANDVQRIMNAQIEAGPAVHQRPCYQGEGEHPAPYKQREEHGYRHGIGCMRRTETVVLQTKIIHYLYGIFYQRIVGRSPSGRKRFDDSLGNAIGKKDAQECAAYNKTNLPDCLIIAHHDDKEYKIERYPGETRSKCHHQLVENHIVTAVEPLQYLKINILYRTKIHLLIVLYLMLNVE